MSEASGSAIAGGHQCFEDASHIQLNSAGHHSVYGCARVSGSNQFYPCTTLQVILYQLHTGNRELNKLRNMLA